MGFPNSSPSLPILFFKDTWLQPERCNHQKRTNIKHGPERKQKVGGEKGREDKRKIKINLKKKINNSNTVTLSKKFKN